MKQVVETARPSPAVFAQLYKVDEERRLIYARAATEEPDHSDEMMDYESSKPLFQQWSADVHKDSGGKSFGNVREMHQPLAVGKLTEIEFDDDNQSVDVVLKVVDNDAWDKVLEGVYTGLSIGGKYVRKWNGTHNGQEIKRYTAAPSEISLVDRPCMPSSKFFEVMKRDGSVEQHEFVKYNEDQPRDDHGRFGDGHDDGDVMRGKAATHDKLASDHYEASKMASKAGDPHQWDDHQNAARAHGKAADSYRIAATRFDKFKESSDADHKRSAINAMNQGNAHAWRAERLSDFANSGVKKVAGLTKGSDNEERDDHGRWSGSGAADAKEGQKYHSGMQDTHQQAAKDAEKRGDLKSASEHHDIAAAHAKAAGRYMAAAMSYKDGDSALGEERAGRAFTDGDEANSLSYATKEGRAAMSSAKKLRKDAGQPRIDNKFVSREDHARAHGKAHDAAAKAHQDIADNVYEQYGEGKAQPADVQAHDQAANLHDDASSSFYDAARSYAKGKRDEGDSKMKEAQANAKTAWSASKDTGAPGRKIVREHQVQSGSVEKILSETLFDKQELTDMATLLRRAAGGKVRKDFVSPAGDTSGIAPYDTDAPDKPAGRRMKRPKDDPDMEDVSGDGGESEIASGPKGSTSTTKRRLGKYSDDEARDDHGRWGSGSTGATLKSSGWKEKAGSGASTFTHDNKPGVKYSVSHRTGSWSKSGKEGEASGKSTKDLKQSWAGTGRYEKVRKPLAFDVDGTLEKGTYAVGSLAGLISGLESWAEGQVWEDKAEGQDKPTSVAGKVKGQVVELLGLLAEYAEEEADELKELTAGEEQIDHGPTVLTMAEKLGDLFKRAKDGLEKKGARNSKADGALLQKLHDTAVALGADCGSAKITPIGKSTGDTHMRVRKGGIEAEGPKRGSKIGNETDSEHSDNEEHDGEEGTASGTERRESKGGNVNSKRGVGKAQRAQNQDDEDDDEDENEEDMDDEDEEDEKPAKKNRAGGRVAKRRDEDDDTMSQKDLAKMVATTVVATLQGLGIIEANDEDERPVRKSRRQDDDDEGLEKFTRAPRRPALFAVEKGGDTEELGKSSSGNRIVRDDGDPLELALAKRVAQPIVTNAGKMDVASTLIKHIHGQRPMRTVTADGMTLKS